MSRFIGRRGYTRFGVLVALTLAMLVATAGTASAAGGHKVVGNSYVIYNTKGNALLVATPAIVDKATHDGTADALAAGITGPQAMSANLCVLCSENVYWSGHGSQAYAGSSVTVNFSSHDAGSCGWTTCDDYIDGNSHTYWWGTNPYNANSMDLNDTITVTGCALSVNVSWPPGVGFSGGGDQAHWDSGWTGATWQVNHYFSGIHFWTYCARWYISQSSQGNARFGVSTFVTAHANGGANI